MEENKIDDKELDNKFVFAETDYEESEKLAVEPYSYWKSVFRVFIHKKSAIVSIVIIAVLILMAIIVPFCFPSWYAQTNILTSSPGGNLVDAAPSWKHIFGCDVLGRDLFVILFKGIRVSLSLALVVSLINAFFGILIGMIWGYFRKLDPILIEVYNFFGNIPSLLLYMLLLTILNQVGANIWVSFIFVLTITGWLDMARFIRNQIIIINDREYNLASKTLGTPAFRIITHNLLPFILPVIITNISLAIPSAISAETSLSYFGVGLKGNAIALGPILTCGYQSWMSHPWELLWPTVILGLITISFYLLGLALSDALDPRSHR